MNRRFHGEVVEALLEIYALGGGKSDEREESETKRP